MDVMGALRGGFFPENWDLPLAMGLGVVATGYLGDTIAGFIGQFIPAEWLNPASEIVIGVLLFFLGGMGGLAGISSWLRMASLGAFAVGIADAVSIITGMVVPSGARAATTTRVVQRTASTPGSVASKYQVRG
jgi:vacuolar-type H+-ATPase subunit I/STV1